MQVKGISAPVEALRSRFGARFFLASGQRVAGYTHDVDTDERMTVEESAWISVPFGRDVLIAAGMANADVTIPELAAFSDDQVREWVIVSLICVGRDGAEPEMRRFDGYAEDAQAAAFFELMCERVDRAFGFGAGTAGVTAQVPGARPDHPVCPGRAARPKRSNRALAHA